MPKLYISLLLGLVICTQLVCLGEKFDDEFAEFDTDIVPDEQQDSSKDQVNDKTEIFDDKDQDYQSNKNTDNDNVESEKEESRSEEDESKNRKKTDNLKLVNAPAPKFRNWESYYVEIVFLFSFCLYFMNFFLGSSKNSKFAHDWYQRTKDLLKQQFTLVGGAPQFNDGQKKDDDGEVISPTNKKQRGLIKATESMYTLWSSGRVGVDGLLIEINLLKRQDLFSMALNLLKPTKDTMILRFLLNQDGYENFVFCLAHKSHAPKLARDMIDISTFCPKKKAISQYGINSERLFIMSELADVASFILDQNMATFVKNYEKSINFIHITDQYSTIKSEDVQPAQKLANSKRMATFSFSLPETDSEVNEFLTFAFGLLDRLRRFKLARDSKQKSEKNRQKITDIIQKSQFLQRQEAAQARKEELRRLEKERIYNEDDPEKQRSWQRKEDKRELKRSKMRVKQLKVKSM